MKCVRRKNGFTLLETLVTLLFVILIFGLVTDLLAGALRASNVQRQKVLAAEAAQLALTRMACEVRESVKINSVSPLSFIKFNAAEADASYVDTAANANRFEHVLEVHYVLTPDNVLMREVGVPGGSMTAYTVVDGIKGFSCSRDPLDPDGNVIITLTVNIGGTLRTLQTEVAPMAALP